MEIGIKLSNSLKNNSLLQFLILYRQAQLLLDLKFIFQQKIEYRLLVSKQSCSINLDTFLPIFFYFDKDYHSNEGRKDL